MASVNPLTLVALSRKTFSTLSTLLPALAVAAATSACSEILGADFSDLRPPDSNGDATAGSGGGRGAPSDAETDGAIDGAHAGGARPDGAAGTAGVGAESGAGGSGGFAGGDAQLDRIARDAAVEGSATDGSGSDDVTVDRVVIDAASGDRFAPDGEADASASDGSFDQATGDVADGAHETSIVADAADEGEAEGPGQGIVTINELNGQGSVEDFVELYNHGTASFDLSGYSVTQGRGPADSPDLNALLTFGAGATLAPGQYLLVVANQSTRGGPHDPCDVSGFPNLPCYYVDWGISKTDRERIYLLAPNNSIVDFADFPAPDAGQPPSGRSWGRYPDGMGTFQHTLWSPGSSNRIQ